MTPRNPNENRGRPSNISHTIFSNHRPILKIAVAQAKAEYISSGHWKYRLVSRSIEYEIQFRKRLGQILVAEEHWSMSAVATETLALPDGWQLIRKPCGNTHALANAPALYQKHNQRKF